MKFVSKIVTFGAILGLGACSNAQDSGTVMEASDSDIVKITHNYQGVTYPLDLKWDSILKGFIVISESNSDISWTASEADDIKFQNMARSAFREQVCEEGLHPGVLQFGYAFIADFGWVARVKCTDKFQADA